MTTFEQRASEVIAYRQAIEGDTISDSVWAISPTGPGVTRLHQTDTDTVAMVSEIAADKKYTLTVLITCASGQVFERSVIIRGV